MEALRQYAVSVTSAAILCGILTSLLHKGFLCDLVRLVCGIMLTAVLIGPLTKTDPFHWQQWDQNFTADAQVAAAAGERYCAESLAAVIKEETQAYILTKARNLDLNLTVEVILSRDTPPIPEQVRISGEAAPLARQKLMDAVSDELGIAKENLIWIG